MHDSLLGPCPDSSPDFGPPAPSTMRQFGDPAARFPVDHGRSHHQIYSPLSSDSRQVRFLTLKTAEGAGSEFSCSLHIRDLTDQPSYRALSYVWGDAKNLSPIVVNGVELRVTKNLKAALRALSSKQLGLLHTFLWIDAICI
jgi:hypothetical protein